MNSSRDHGPDKFAALLARRIQASRKSANQVAAEVGGISGQAIRDWTRLTADSSPPKKATWPLVHVLEVATHTPTGALWRALNGDDPPPDGDDEPEVIDLAMVLAEVRELRREVADLRARTEAAQARPAGRGTGRRAVSPTGVARP